MTTTTTTTAATALTVTSPAATIPVTIRMCDANGRNVGSRSLKVLAIGLSPSGDLNDSGRSNPGNLFRFDDGKYIFNLSTKGLIAGDYTLDFTVGNDPTIYHYAFTIRPPKGQSEKSDGQEKSGNDNDHGNKSGDNKGGKSGH